MLYQFKHKYKYVVYASNLGELLAQATGCVDADGQQRAQGSEWGSSMLKRCVINEAGARIETVGCVDPTDASRTITPENGIQWWRSSNGRFLYVCHIMAGKTEGSFLEEATKIPLSSGETIGNDLILIVDARNFSVACISDELERVEPDGS